jgi:hypothetical protein
MRGHACTTARTQCHLAHPLACAPAIAHTGRPAHCIIGGSDDAKNCVWPKAITPKVNELRMG